MSYSIKEIIDIAIGIEEAGIAFYRSCIEKFNDSQLSEVFSFLAEQEKEHRDKFETIYQQEAKPSGIFNNEYFSYMQSIGGGRIFGSQKNIGEIIDTITDETAAVRHAFNDERESILFYSEMKKLYESDDPTQKLLDSIIEEERQHVLTLTDLAEKIKLSC